jgi:hypothetical protein
MTQGNDCFRCCVASILDLSATDFPTPPDEFTDDNWSEYVERLQEAVRAHGFEMLTLTWKPGTIRFHARGLAIASFQSPDDTQDVLHCVIFKDGQFLWDPSPEYRTKGIQYLGEPVDWIVFQAVDPSAFIYRRQWPNRMAEEIIGGPS